jgi:DNA-binding transcriptional regulator YhcF (GntR family)
MLPSIRAVETELGVGRMLVRKAYQQLQAAGVVRLVHGKGVVVTGDGLTDGRYAREATALIETTLQEVRRRGLEPVSFSRLLHQRVLAENQRVPAILCVDSSEILARDMGRQVEQFFGLRTRAASLAELAGLRPTIAPGVLVLVNFYHLEETRKALRQRAPQVLPVSWEFASSLLEHLRRLPVRSRILLLFYEAHLEQAGTRVAIDHLRACLEDRQLAMGIAALERVGRLDTLARSRYRAVVVSNQIWDRHEAFFLKHPQKFWRLATRLDARSLQAVTDRLGFVL